MRPRDGRRALYKLLSVLLQYPGDEVEGAHSELEAASRQCAAGAQRELSHFLAYWEATPWPRLREEYVATFDLQRRCSLYLTYFTHGDTRRRGQELLRLKWLYRAAGLELEGPELPDYLPVMLEFASLVGGGASREVLQEQRMGLEVLWLRLNELDSPYAHLIQLIRRSVAPLAASQLEVVRRLIQDGPPAEAVGLRPFAPPEVMPWAEVHR